MHKLIDLQTKIKEDHIKIIDVINNYPSITQHHRIQVRKAIGTIEQVLQKVIINKDTK